MKRSSEPRLSPGNKRRGRRQQQKPAGKLQKLGLAVRAFVEAARGDDEGGSTPIPEALPPRFVGRRNRRELRREKRKLKRGRRRQRLSGREETEEAAEKGKKKPRSTAAKVPAPKKRSPPPPPSLPEAPQRKERPEAPSEEARRRERRAAPKPSASVLARKRALLAANEAEDREIRRLERQLGLSKRRKKDASSSLPPSFAKDGLDYVLGALDSGATLAGLYGSSEGEEEDEEREEGGEETEEAEGRRSEEEGELSSEEEEELSVAGEDIGDSGESSSGEESDNRSPDFEGSETGAVEPASLEVKEEENHQVATKYVPPQMRKSEECVDVKKMEELERLKKTLKGLINRLSEPNLASISGQLEELYMLNSRKDMNETLTNMIITACVTTTAMPSRLVMEHVLLVSILHQTVGIEVGAYFLETVVRKFDDIYRSEAEGKECENLLILIANLYNFHVVHSLLIFDILKKLVHTFSEKDIELILSLLKNVGFSLRKDDALGLKELITEAQKKASTVGRQFQDQSRVCFMLETMLALKNNDMRKIPGYDPEPVEKLRKLQRTLIHSSSSGKEAQLRVSLESLLSADQVGRWWIVGSSWSGAPMVDSTSNKIQQILPGGKVSSKILELARKQRMNTDIRRNIFCILMTSEDFLDAFEKLLKLRLKDQQEREVVHVLVDCCLQEKTYNPFYAYLSAKFCEYERRFQKTYQFTLLDKIRDLGNLSATSFSNLVHLLTHLLKGKSLSLTVFKVIEFSELDKPKVHFLRQVLSALLLKADPEELNHIFGKLADNPKLGMLHEGLKLFLTHFLLKNIQAHKNAEEATLLKERIELVTKALKAKESRLKL